MPYGEQNSKEIFDEKEQDIHKKIALCEAVKETIDSNGWQKTIGPIIDRLIYDVVGGKKESENKWYYGDFSDPESEKDPMFYVGYKQALIHLHNLIMRYPRSIETLKSQLEALKKKKEEEYTDVDQQSKYAPEEEKID